MESARELEGYRTLVTGGTRGIGGAVAARLREVEQRSLPPPARDPTLWPRKSRSWLRISPLSKAARRLPTQ